MGTGWEEDLRMQMQLQIEGEMHCKALGLCSCQA